MLPCASMIARPDVANCQTSANANAIKSPGSAPANDLVTHAADAIVHVGTSYSMYGGIGSGGNGRVPHRGIRRKILSCA